MDLYIRSQDKEILTKCDCLSLKKYGVFPNHIIVAHIRNNIIDLGIYKTKERALEILDEIQDKIVINYGYELATNSGIRPDNIKSKSYTAIYEMPQG